ncbi:MAG: hypothetical protein EA382_01200 [Spirochaetaceae bacterium]|nr:MAG: hypothetical protein EA382_01200 [Spirochaetaceae bacterium]
MVNGPLQIVQGGLAGPGMSAVPAASIQGLGASISRNHQTRPGSPTAGSVVTLVVPRTSLPPGTSSAGYSTSLNLRFDTTRVNRMHYSGGGLMGVSGGPIFVPAVGFNELIGGDPSHLHIVASAAPHPDDHSVWYDDMIGAFVLDASDPTTSVWWVDVLAQPQFTPDALGLTDADPASVLAFRSNATGYARPGVNEAQSLALIIIEALHAVVEEAIRLRHMTATDMGWFYRYALQNESMLFDQLNDGDDQTPDVFSFSFLNVYGDGSTEPVAVVDWIDYDALPGGDYTYEVIREWFGTSTYATDYDELRYRFNVHFREPFTIGSITVLRGFYSLIDYGYLYGGWMSFSDQLLQFGRTRDWDDPAVALSAALDVVFGGTLYNVRIGIRPYLFYDVIPIEPSYIVVNSRYVSEAAIVLF